MPYRGAATRDRHPGRWPSLPRYRSNHAPNGTQWMDAIILQILNGLDKGGCLCADCPGPDPDLRHARRGELCPRRAVHDGCVLRRYRSTVVLTLSHRGVHGRDANLTFWGSTRSRSMCPTSMIIFGEATGDAIIDWSVPLLDPVRHPDHDADRHSSWNAG